MNQNVGYFYLASSHKHLQWLCDGASKGNYQSQEIPNLENCPHTCQTFPNIITNRPPPPSSKQEKNLLKHLGIPNQQAQDMPYVYVMVYGAITQREGKVVSNIYRHCVQVDIKTVFDNY